MALLDLKKSTIRFVDGRLATLTTTAANGVNAQITLTDKSRHRGTRTPVKIELIDPPGNNVALSIAVTGTTISVTLATDGSSVITTTASQLKTAIEANGSANALVTVTLPGTGAAVVSAQALTSLANGARSLTVKVEEGEISWTETVNREYSTDRGLLDKVRDGDQAPVEVSLNARWEFIKASTGSGTPTPFDVLENAGEASAWVSTSNDQCQPFSIDIEIFYEPGCSPTENEIYVLEEFRWEEEGFQFKDGVVAITGKLNRTQVEVYRQAA